MNEADPLLQGAAPILTMLLAMAVALLPIVLCVAGVGVWLYRHLSQLRAAHRARVSLMHNGVPARAHIRTLGTGPVVLEYRARRSLQLIVELEVSDLDHPSRGPQPPYTVQLTTIVPEVAIGRIRPQRDVPVRVDPDDPQRVVFDLLAMGYTDTGAPP